MSPPSPSAPYEFQPFPERRSVRLLGNARVGVYIGVKVETYDPAGPGPALLPSVADRPVDPISAGWRDYGPRVGLWRPARRDRRDPLPQVDHLEIGGQPWSPPLEAVPT